jgi:hypothetical protein
LAVRRLADDAPVLPPDEEDEQAATVTAATNAAATAAALLIRLFTLVPSAAKSGRDARHGRLDRSH